MIGQKKLVSSFIHSCLTCRKLRRQVEQKMGNFPECRLNLLTWDLTPLDPGKFVHVSVNRKSLAILFTCLTSRAVHLELIEDVSSSTFINALRRFIAVRRKVTAFRSDKGTQISFEVQTPYRSQPST